jgi:hypothetical protein
MLKKLFLAGFALFLFMVSRSAAASCWSDGCNYEIGNEPAGAWIEFDVYAQGTLYVTAYTKVNGGGT